MKNLLPLNVNLPRPGNETNRRGSNLQIFLFDYQYILIAYRDGREVYWSTIKDLVRKCVGDEPGNCWQIFDPEQFPDGDRLLEAKIDSNILSIRPWNYNMTESYYEPIEENILEVTIVHNQYLLMFRNNQWIRYPGYDIFYSPAEGPIGFGFLLEVKRYESMNLQLYTSGEGDVCTLVVEDKSVPRFNRILRKYYLQKSEFTTNVFDTLAFDVNVIIIQGKVIYVGIRSVYVLYRDIYNNSYALRGDMAFTPNDLFDGINTQSEALVDINDEYKLTYDSTLINLRTNEQKPFPEPTASNTHLWIPLGFCTQNRSYHLKIKITDEYLQPVQILLQPSGRKWNLSSEVGKTVYNQSYEGLEVKRTLADLKDKPTEEKIKRLFYIINRYGRFCSWSVSSKLERLLFWTAKEIIYLHPNEADVWISPPLPSDIEIADTKVILLKEDGAIRQPYPVSASDDGLIIARLSNETYMNNQIYRNNQKYILYWARDINIDRPDIVAPAYRDQIANNLSNLRIARSRAVNLPSEIEEQILRYTNQR